MQRRSYLRAVGATGASLGLAGCVGGLASLGDPNPNVTLSEPDRQYESADVPYPAWGQRVPDVTLPAATTDASVSFPDLSRPTFVTFFYSTCMTVCPLVVSELAAIQDRAIETDYADRVTFAPITFDPQRDTPETLATYAEEMNVDLTAGNWRFLRPESRERAQAVVGEEFGLTFERTQPDDMDQYMFTHGALVLLVNADGYVERAYRDRRPPREQMASDLETVLGVA
ncbi:SCO family protein [Halobaculum sp. MBLA0147]|uniref:SCO family protein n=1 Tax=Halobaculum sp. MBLA0147 TaxID=3079934 RepID=UPI00352551C5